MNLNLPSPKLPCPLHLHLGSYACAGISNLRLQVLILKKIKKPLFSRKYLKIGNDKIVIFEPDFPVFWEVEAQEGA